MVTKSHEPPRTGSSKVMWLRNESPPILRPMFWSLVFCKFPGRHDVKLVRGLG